MINMTSATRNTLKNLIQILHDGRDGYRQAADNVRDTRLKDLFEMLATQRSQFARELEPYLSETGEKSPEKEGGTISGAVHRGWIDLKSTLTSQDTHAILAEVERGEDAAKKGYSEALDGDDLSEDVRRVIANQSADVLQAHNRIRDLRDAAEQRSA